MNRFVLLLLFTAAIGISASRAADRVELIVATKDSLTRNGPAPVIRTEAGDEAAKQLYAAIVGKSPEQARTSRDTFATLSKENPQSPNYYGLLWITQNWLALHEKREINTPSPFFRFVWELLAAEDFALVREYLQRQFAAGGFEPEDMAVQAARIGFLEDLIMFNNPYRDQWANTEKLVDHLDIKPGERILDVGSGFGYFSTHFANRAGKEGKVFAVDINEAAIGTSKDLFRKLGQSNVEQIVSKIDDVVVTEPVDTVFFCSLYHVIYSWQKEIERRAFIASIKRCLKPEGRLIIVENRNLSGHELNSCYVSEPLVVAQLLHYGFRLERSYEASDLQFVMEFRHTNGEPFKTRVGSSAQGVSVPITSARSLIHIGSLDSYDVTDKGIACAKLAYKALVTKNPADAALADAEYDKIIPKENFGGEYSALQWFCRLLATESPDRRSEMLADPLVETYHDFLAENDFEPLKAYILLKYKLKPHSKIASSTGAVGATQPSAAPQPSISGTDTPAAAASESTPAAPRDAQISRDVDKGPSVANTESENPKDVREIGQTRRAFIEDFILFNNPRRPQWEQTDKILAELPYKAGDRIADIGCGGGYYTSRFAKNVTPTGMVYAIDIKQDHLDFINKYAKGSGLRNIRTVKATVDNLALDDQVDHAFMCSLYHIIYGVNSFGERDKWLLSVKRSLKPGGTLTIVDNNPVQESSLPYHGPHIAKELVIAQLAQYGFTLEKYKQIIPQRYLLLFRHTDPQPQRPKDQP